MRVASIFRNYQFLTIASIFFLSAMSYQVHGDEPGSVPAANSIQPETAQSVEPFATEFGKISLSIDGLGTLSPGFIQVEKPAGATVRKAFLAAASTGLSRRELSDGDIKIDGSDVLWNLVAAIPTSISSSNSLADVTDLVKAKIDAAPAGLVEFQIDEVGPSGIDGEILAVIMDDPNQTTDNTVVLLFGAQNVNGDNFAVSVAEPIDTNDSNLVVDMSLGISFGFQRSGVQQYSEVRINGLPLTTSAGGEDDAEDPPVAGNGRLITVGGVGDTNENPADPLATPTGPFSDDELYNLLPFVESGDTSIAVSTINPSDDDNIFFAGFFFGASTAIIGEGIFLEPATSTNPLNTQHTVTATVRDDDGNPIEGREVIFEVVAGPNSGVSGVLETDVDGETNFTYMSGVPGTDVIEANMIDSASNTVRSNQVNAIWTDILPGKAILISPNGNITESNPTYVWNAVATAEQYRLWVQDEDTREKFTQWYTADAANCGDGVCEVNPAELLGVEATLYGDRSMTWWIRTWNSAGFGPWSDPMSYQVLLSDVPAVTMQIAPIGPTNNPVPTYEWAPTAGATWYKIQVWEVGSPDFTINQWYRDIDAACTATSCTVAPDNLLLPSNYVWRIRAWNNAGVGPWSNITAFDISISD